MNCGICKGYLREKNKCNGCKNIEKNRLKSRVRCRIRICKKRKGAFCYQCTEFPCDLVKHIDKRYRTRYGMSMIENLKYIQKNGIQKFVRNEKKRWVKGDKVLCVHDREWYSTHK